MCKPSQITMDGLTHKLLSLSLNSTRYSQHISSTLHSSLFPTALAACYVVCDGLVKSKECSALVLLLVQVCPVLARVRSAGDRQPPVLVFTTNFTLSSAMRKQDCPRSQSSILDSTHFWCSTTVLQSV